jgi:hypothetical protein
MVGSKQASAPDGLNQASLCRILKLLFKLQLAQSVRCPVHGEGGIRASVGSQSTRQLHHRFR